MNERWQCMMITAQNPRELEAKVNDRGTEGWELVAVMAPRPENDGPTGSVDLFYVAEYTAWLKRRS